MTDTSDDRRAHPAPRPTLLHLDASAGPREESVSRRLTSLFADVWRKRQDAAGRAHRYLYRDLTAEPVPPTGPAYAALGRRVERCGGVVPERVAALVEDADEEREWALTLPLTEQLRAADTVLLGVPMYNFSVPAGLKAWIDRVTFPAAFTAPGTGAALLGGTRVVAVLTRGGAYGPGTPRETHDFQAPYLRAYFGALGIAADDVHLVKAEMTVSGLVPELARFRGVAEDSLRSAREAVRRLALDAGPARPGAEERGARRSTRPVDAPGTRAWRESEGTRG